MNLVTDIALPLSLAFIMLTMGLALSVRDFRPVATEPRAAAIGLVAQLVLLPLLAFALVLAWDVAWGMHPALAVGFMIIAACPGGVMSNLLTHLARGDTALSISLTAVSSLASTLTIPLIVAGAMAWFLGADAPPLPIGQTIVGIFAIVTVPVVVGMAARAAAPGWTARAEPVCRRVAMVLFVLIVVAAVVTEWPLLRRHFADIGPPVLLLNLACMAMGATLARLARLGRRQAIAITLETGLQNGTLAVLIAATFLGDDLMVVPGGVYALLMFVSAGAFVLHSLRRR